MERGGTWGRGVSGNVDVIRSCPTNEAGTQSLASHDDQEHSVDIIFMADTAVVWPYQTNCAHPNLSRKAHSSTSARCSARTSHHLVAGSGRLPLGRQQLRGGFPCPFNTYIPVRVQGFGGLPRHDQRIDSKI